MNRRPIVHDSISFPLAGSHDRRRTFDADPTIARPALENHLRRSMGAQNFATAIDLLNDYADSLLGLGAESEGEGEAMDSRFDPRPGDLAKMFPHAKAPLRVFEGGEAESRAAMDARVHDHRPGELAKMFGDAPNPRRAYR